MLFIVFDIEIVFLYPLGVVLHQLAWFGFAELAFFLLILLLRTSTSGARARSSGSRPAEVAPPGRARPAVRAPALAGQGPSEFEQELGDIESQLGLTTLEKAVAWSQTKSMWPDTFGLACCAIEMMSIVSSRYDIARFGMEAFRSRRARPTC
jgi:hypothetical protein